MEAEILCKGGDTFQAWKAAYKLAKGFKAHHKIHNPMRMTQADCSYAQNDFQNTKVFKNHSEQLLNNINTSIKQKFMNFWTTKFFVS